MKRMTQRVQCDECPSCHAAVLTASRDDYWGLDDAIICDPTPLTKPQEMACVLLGRARYALEMTAAKSFRLSRISEHLNETVLFWPALHLPGHRCAARFDQALPADVAKLICPVVGEVADSLASVPF